MPLPWKKLNSKHALECRHLNERKPVLLMWCNRSLFLATLLNDKLFYKTVLGCETTVAFGMGWVDLGLVWKGVRGVGLG